jgi:S1-C subfamily serine protease
MSDAMRPRIVALVVLLAAVSAWAPGARARETPITSSVVQLFVYSDPPDLTTPWQTEGVVRYGGSGVIIEGRRILTSAHVVESAVGIEAKRADGSERFAAKVTFISHDADLALVEVEDPRFFDDTRAVPIGDMPRIEQGVVAYGFPIGGTTLSITSGIVSRVEVDTYLQSNRDFLLVQIDAAVNEGNSGGPVVANGAVVGIAVQGMEDADNVGYMIPSPVIQHFLKDVSDGRCDGLPTLGIQVQDMESEAQRRAARMEPSQTGALVVRVDYGGPSHGVLKPRDVLLEVDGRAIANDLTVFWPGIGRVDHALAYQSKQMGETVAVAFLRDGKKVEKTIQLRPHTPLVPGRRTTEWPRYFHFGGIVFQPLSEELLDDPEAVYPDSLCYAVMSNVVTKEHREIILIGQVLPHPVNRGYQDWGGETIRLVNGVVPRDLAHLASIIDGAAGKWLHIATGDGGLLTLDTQAARRANDEILESYGLPQDRYLGLDSEPPRRARKRGR